MIRTNVITALQPTLRFDCDCGQTKHEWRKSKYSVKRRMLFTILVSSDKETVNIDTLKCILIHNTTKEKSLSQNFHRGKDIRHLPKTTSLFPDDEIIQI